MEFAIDEGLRKLIPALSEAEREQLEQNVIKDGCRDPLVIWAERDVLLDGHHRLEICRRRKLPYKTERISLKDRDAAKAWVITNQFGRRNLAPYVRAELALQLEPLIAGRAKANMRAGGGSGPSGRQNSAHPTKTREEVAKVAGVSHDTIHKAKKIAEQAPESVKAKLRIGETTINSAYQDIRRKEKEAKRQTRREQNKKKVEAASKPTDLVGSAQFATIVIDPPWDWGDEGDVDQMGRAKPTYETIPYEKLPGLPVAALSDDDCHLYVWITNRSLPKGFALIEAWGFRYVTCLTWAKPSFGMGNYFRGQTEHVLFAIKGSQPLKRKDVGTVFHAARGKEHSSKPEEFYCLVETCSPGPYLEMFSRRLRDGWTQWGEDS